VESRPVWRAAVPPPLGRLDHRVTWRQGRAGRGDRPPGV